MAGKYELKASAGGFTFNLKSGNSKVILTSETYSDKAAALEGIKSVKRNAGKDKSYERKTSVSNQAFFVLKAPNGETIGKSEMYSSNSAMEKGIASVKANAGAPVSESVAKK